MGYVAIKRVSVEGRTILDWIFVGCGKVKLSLYRLWRPLGLREVEAPTFSDIQLVDGAKVVSPRRRPLFTPRKSPGTHFC
jgi:hypothetical protein